MDFQLKQADLAAERIDTIDSTPAACGRITDAPAQSTNVQGRDGVRVPSEATSDTHKLCLRPTIALVDQPAGGTGATGVARIDVDHWHASSLRLAGDKVAELTERPGMQRGPLGLPSRDAL